MNVKMLPQIVLPTPILSLLAGENGRVWAGGMGGVAAYENGQWVPYIAGLPVSGVAALASAGKWLLAGGAEGIARSVNGGVTWQFAAIQGTAGAISTLVTSPSFEQDSSALAATLTGGVLRSEDSGQTWTAANFGLGDFEVTALLWQPNDTVLAATVNGIYRSPNGGRAWRETAGNEGQAVAALVQLPDGRLLAALEAGGLLISDDGARWSELAHDLPDEIEPAALCVLDDGALLLGAVDSGIFRSDDGGSHWSPVCGEGVFSLAQSAGIIYAGSGTDVLMSRDGWQFEVLPRPPLHDLRQLTAVGDNLLVYGRYSGALAFEGYAWQPLTAVSPPLGLLYSTPSGTLYASSMDGLRRWQADSDWETLIEGQAGYFSQFVMRDDGRGWACSHDYRHLLRTDNGGVNWQASASPFGVLPLMALEAAPGLVFGATFDARQNTARMWRSQDSGVNWQPGAEVRTPWPLVATHADPPLVALGSMIAVEQQTDHWQRGEVSGMADFLVRQIAGDSTHLLALTTRGLLHSTDGGLNWSPLEGLDLPADAMMSVAMIGDTVYVLLVGGQVACFSL